MSFLDNILVFDTEYTKVRVGDKKDGGYVGEKILFFSHVFKISGSFTGKLAFIEKAVFGSCKVSFDIIFLPVLYQVVFVFLNISNF